MSVTEENLTHLIEPFVREMGYELYELSFRPMGKVPVLAVIIDHGKIPIDLDEIVTVSEKISTFLDNADAINSAYTLDVSSAGAEKRINPSGLEEYVDFYVKVHVSEPVDGDNYLSGLLESVTSQEVVITDYVKTRKRTRTIVRSNIDKANLAVKF